MARGTADEVYFNQPRVHLAFAKLPRYDNRGNSKNRLRIAGEVTTRRTGLSTEVCEALDKIRDVCWLTWAKSSGKPYNGEPTVKRIGLWGQVWALAIVWSLVRTEYKRDWTQDQDVTCLTGPAPPMTIPALANEIYNFGEIHGLLPENSWKHELTAAVKSQPRLEKHLISETRELLETLLGRMWQDKSVIPPVEQTRKLHACVAHFVLHQLSKSAVFAPRKPVSTADLLAHLEHQDYPDPMHCFWGIVDFIGLAELVKARDQDDSSAPPQTGLSWFEPTIWRYITSTEGQKRHSSPDDLTKHVAHLRFTLGYSTNPSDAHNPIAVLSGPAHSGKKSVVGDFLKAIAADQPIQDIRFPMESDVGAAKTKLPVFCIQTNERDYVSLCIQVLVFLERVTEAQTSVERKPQEEAVKERWAILDQMGSAPAVQPLLDRIQELHEKAPALFVFLDVRHATTPDMRNVVRRYGVRRLVETLAGSNVDSRFLITTGTLPLGGDFLRPLKPKRIELNLPTCDRIRWYLNDDREAAFDLAADGQGFSQFRDREISGDALMALAVLFGQNAMSDAEFFTFFSSLVIPGDTVGDTAVERVCSRLLEGWDRELLLPLMTLIIASEDGMMTSTLEQCIAAWSAGVPDLCVVSMKTGLERLWDIKGLARGLFLTHQVPPNFAVAETRFDEPAPGTHEEYFRTWQFDPTLSQVFRRLLARKDNHVATLRQAYRLIAGQARSRAHFQQIRGMMQQRAFGPQLPERSVQAYVALLLSLEPSSGDRLIDSAPFGEASSSRGIDATILPLATDQVFQVGSDFDPAVAVRYAYHVLLRSEADLDHRLSMILDADFLRLHLYTLLCADPGTLLHWDQKQYQTMRTDLPPALKNATLKHLEILSPQTCAELLAGLSMAAYYAGHYAILLWAQERLFDLLPASPAIVNELSRAVAARVDMETHIGCPLSSFVTAQGSPSLQSQDRLPAVRLLLAEQIRTICKGIPEDITHREQTDGVSQSLLSAWLRLEARAIHLDDLLDPNADTADRLGMLRTFEGRYLRDHDIPRSLSQHGRTGRLNMKSMLGCFPVFTADLGFNHWSDYEKNCLLEQLNALVYANGSRLSRFSGSERALTLIDHAHQLLLQGNLSASLSAVEEARRISFLGTSSEFIRLEVLMLETTILLALIEQDSPADAETHTKAKAHWKDTIDNISFIDGLISEWGLELEMIGRNVLVWRAQKIARLRSDIGLKAPFLKEITPLRSALVQAKAQGAMGLHARLARLEPQPPS